MTHRPDVQLDKINDEISELSALGTTNNLLPFLQGRALTNNKGISGPLNPDSTRPVGAFALGGLGNALFELGQFEQAAECLIRACQLNPRDAISRNHRNVEGFHSPPCISLSPMKATETAPSGPEPYPRT